MLNSVNLSGRLTAEPELKQTNSGTSVMQFTIAVDRYTKAGEEKKADFITCVAWKQTAEFISKYFAKGQMIIVEGGLQVRNYTDKNDVKHYVTEVIVNHAHFAGSKAENGTKNTETAFTAPKATNFEEIEASDDLPF